MLGMTEKIIDFEEGNMDEGETIEMFQELLDTGLVWHLQGHYGRACQSLLDAGHIVDNKEALVCK